MLYRVLEVVHGERPSIRSLPDEVDDVPQQPVVAGGHGDAIEASRNPNEVDYGAHELDCEPGAQGRE